MSPAMARWRSLYDKYKHAHHWLPVKPDTVRVA